MYKNVPKYNSGSIVFIPDYVYKQLTKLGITSEKLYMVASMVTSSDVNNIMNQLAGVLKKGMSTRDIRDIRVMNKVMYKALFNSSLYIPSITALSVLLEICDMATGEYIDDDNNENEVINLYANQKIDIETILMSGNNKNELYTCDVMTETLLVIIHDGFTNFILNNDKKTGKKLSEGLLNYYAQRLGTDSYEKSFLVTM